jgi:hypothetical protein
MLSWAASGSRRPWRGLVAEEIAPGTGIVPEAFWSAFAGIVADLGGEARVGLCGAASMIWIMAVGSAVLLQLGIGRLFPIENPSGRSDTDPDTRGDSVAVLHWPEMIGWQRWRRGFPGVLRTLVPFLPPGPAGSILLTRDSTGMEAHPADGRIFCLPRDGFEHGKPRLLKALTEHGVRHLSALGTG